MLNKKLLIVLNIVFVCNLNAADVIKNIFIERHKVFEKDDKDYFFASSFLNSLHAVTKEYIIKDELLFHNGDELLEDLFLETERNLRKLDLFTKVEIEIDSLGDGLYDVYVVTKDRWSLYPGIIIGASGGEYYLGGRLKDYNLLGHGIMFNIDATYIFSDDTTGYEGRIEIDKKRLFRSEMNLFGAIYKTYLNEGQEIKLEKPFRTLNTNTSYGIYASNTFGKDYFINRKSLLINGAVIDSANSPELIHFLDTLNFIRSKEEKLQLWYAASWDSYDKVYLSALLELQQATRTANIFERAYDNQSKFLLGFSSIAQSFYSIRNVNAPADETLATGGWGNIVLGAIFPTNKEGEKGMFYVGAQLEKSYYSPRLYLFAQLSTSSSFFSDFAKYTYQEFLGLGYYKISNKLIFAVRILEQAAWNYPRYRQLILDDVRGIRGYAMREIGGDNRFISNLEIRYFPDFIISMMQFSGCIFYDIGSIWNQRTYNAFLESRFYSSLGIGIRGHFTKSDNPDHIIRVDIPYNLYTKKFGISLGVRQYFEATSSHKFRLPAIYGAGFDAY
ncbi:MAG: BamA/TamA family outer membrane protein [Bacteroidetes bacterium]|nr:BamA/TamA family outer membrane protein [Bacteroidota bacterium]